MKFNALFCFLVGIWAVTLNFPDRTVDVLGGLNIGLGLGVMIGMSVRRQDRWPPLKAITQEKHND